MLSVQQASALWGVNKRTVQKWVEEGRVPAQRLSDFLAQHGFPGLDFDAWIVLSDERPSPSLAPIVRPRKERPAPAQGEVAPEMMEQSDDTFVAELDTE
jgi:hypothetical protein